MLLYPTVDRQLDLAFRIGSYPVRVCTVDLNREWGEIEARLLSIIDLETTLLPSSARAS